MSESFPGGMRDLFRCLAGAEIIEPDGKTFHTFDPSRWRSASFLVRFEDEKAILIPLVHAKHQRRGSFRTLIVDLIERGYVPLVLCPLPRMQAILTHWGWRSGPNDVWGGPDVWCPPSAALRVGADAEMVEITVCR